MGPCVRRDDVGWGVASGNNLGVLLHRLIRQPLELERERVNEGHLALRAIMTPAIFRFGEIHHCVPATPPQ